MRIATRATIMAVLCTLIPAAPGMGPSLRHGRALPCANPRAVTALATGPGHTLLAGTRGEGLYRSTDGGACWTLITTFPANAEVGTLLVPPGHPHIIVAGSSFVVSTQVSDIGVYRSDDGGRIWTSATTGLPHTPILPFNLAASPHTGALVLSYVCYQDQDYEHPLAVPRCPRGLARSGDGGRTWRAVGPPAQTESARGVVALADGTFLALQLPVRARGNAAGYIYRSRDDGRSWQAAARLPNPTAPDYFNFGGIASFYAVPWDTRRVFIGADDERYRALAYRSTDGGFHWSRPWSPKTHTFPTDAAVIAFAGVSRTHTLLLSDFGRVYRSTDGGTAWNRSNTGLPDGKTVWTLLAPAGGSTVYAGTADSIYTSADDGRTWRVTPS